MNKAKWHQHIENCVVDFIKAAPHAEIQISRSDIDVEFLDVGHVRPTLPPGKVAVYIFKHGDQVLKVGRAGTGSKQRYKTHHYIGSTNSSLNQSMKSDSDYPALKTKTDAEAFIKNYCDRVNILIDKQYYPQCLSLMEAFFQCKLNPKYEGKS